MAMSIRKLGNRCADPEAILLPSTLRDNLGETFRGIPLPLWLAAKDQTASSTS
jgi:hypothetical protein